MTDYLPLPVTKELNNSELAYYRELINGLNNTIGVTVDWLATPEAKELYRKRQDEINAFFEDSGIEADWDTLITSNASNSEEYVNRFYQLGAAIGYSDINRKLSYTKADKEALFHLKKYNFDLVKDVNTELVKGIKKTITEAVAEGNGAEVTSRRLRELPLQPVGNISLETRCNMIARTEHARAVCTGTLQAYSNYDVSMVNVITAGDALVCDDCATAEKNNPHTLLEAQNLLPMHPNSYMPDTQLFTKNGWKYVGDISLDDELLSLNPDTKETEFIKPLNLISHDNDDGFMYHIFNKWFDCCVTPDHDCFVYQNETPTFTKPYELDDSCKFLINNSPLEFIDFKDCTVDKINYSDKVYCVELPKYHTLWTMRNGKTSWNGNCRCTFAPVVGDTNIPPSQPISNPNVVNLIS